MLSRRCARWRVPLAVLLLLSYGMYGIVDAIGYQLWWLALVPIVSIVAIAAAVGVGLRARWGSLLTYAISVLFVLYWLWGVIALARAGFFGSRSPLEGVLTLVPGVAFFLLAGFCCYVSSNLSSGGRSCQDAS